MSLIAIGCGGSADSTEHESTMTMTTDVDIPAGDAVVHSAGPPVDLPEEVRGSVLDKVRAYVRDGVVATLRSGEPDDLASVFEPWTLASLDTDDGAAMLDRGAPEATGDIVATSEPVTFTGLADEAGAVVLVSAHFVVEVLADTADGGLTITRSGDLVFAPGDDGWKVTAYDVVVVRDGAGLEDDDAAAAP